MIDIPINEIFYTIQGEAHWTGTPAVFIRLQGCKVGCAFCDTKHTWSLQKNRQISFEAMLQKSEDQETYAWVSPTSIGDYIKTTWSHVDHCVITGGEPCDYDLQALCNILEEQKKRVQIETSGTHTILASKKAWITVSPKINMPGQLEVQSSAMTRANEIKYPIATERHLRELKNLLEKRWHTPDIEIWLQPISQNRLATQRCIEWCKQYGYKLSLQTHKYCGFR